MRPRRSLPLAIAVCALALTPAAASAAPGFRLGVSSGEVRPHSAKLWARANRAGEAAVQLRRVGQAGAKADGGQAKRGFRRCRIGQAPVSRRVEARRRHDNTVQRLVRHLTPSSLYAYRFCMRGGRHSARGTFATPPKRNATRTIRFAVSGDQDAQPEPGTMGPYWNDFGVLNEMFAAHNDFNVLMGDTIYTDSEVPGIKKDAVTVRRKWRKYRRNLSVAAFARLRGSTAFYSHWDDHEFYNDFSRFENRFSTGSGDDIRSLKINGEKLYRRGVKAFRDYAPVSYTPKDGLYRSFRWGKNLQLFFLDERSFRSAKASAHHHCDNPATGEPDLAPTSDGTIARAEFGLLISSLSEPVSQECKDAINDPRQTMLGHRQLRKFERAIRRSSATFKVIMNEVPIQQFYALPYDRWEGYAAERQKLLTFLHDKIDNVIFLTTDIHANLVNDVRFQTLEPGGPQNSGILEVTTGPVATKSYRREIDDTTTAGVGDGVYATVFKPPPPQGVGMQCAADDVFSYAEVTVTDTTLTVDLKDINGQIVRESAGGISLAPCGPFTITASP
jgi:alkaline phosphatase D